MVGGGEEEEESEVVVVLEALVGGGGGQAPVAKAYQVPDSGSRMMHGSGKLTWRSGVLGVAVEAVGVVAVVEVKAVMVWARRWGAERRRVRKRDVGMRSGSMVVRREPGRRLRGSRSDAALVQRNAASRRRLVVVSAIQGHHALLGLGRTPLRPLACRLDSSSWG